MTREALHKKFFWVAAGALLFGLALLLTSCGYSARTRETWVDELLITGKEKTSRKGNKGDETVYLIHGENALGESQTLEFTDEALAGKFEASQAFYEIKVDKYYKFGVGWNKKGTEGQEGYHPSIYYAVSMKGFSLEEGETQTDDLEAEATEKETESAERGTVETESAKRGTVETESTERRTMETEGAERAENEATQAEGAEEKSETTQAEGAEEENETTQTETTEAETTETEEGRPAEENVKESVKAELEESFEAERESIMASLEESFEAERENLEEELNRLRESVEGLR